MNDPLFDYEINTCGLSCPFPLLRAQQTLLNMASSEVLKVLATDENVEKDLRQFCQKTNHQMLYSQTQQRPFVFFIKHR